MNERRVEYSPDRVKRIQWPSLPESVHVGTNGQVSGSLEQIAFPATKSAVEQQMVDRFIASMNNHLAQSGDRFFLSDPQSNTENDFDFSVVSPNGPAYLELMEITPLRGSYKQAPATYRPYGFARVILNGIYEKSKRYPNSTGRDVFPLLYVTHWSFILSDTTIACLRYWLRARQTAFRAIFSYPLDANEGVPHWLSLFPPQLIGVRSRTDPRQRLHQSRLTRRKGSYERKCSPLISTWAPVYGARPLKRVIQRELQNPLASMILEGRIREGQTVHVGAGDRGLIIDGVQAAAA